MPDYKFNHSGDELLELVVIVINIVGDAPWDANFFFDKKYSFLARQNEILNSRIYSGIEDFIKMANRLVHREPDIIQDAQKIVKMFQNTDDIEGQKFLFNILKGIDRQRVAKDVRANRISGIYSRFLYNEGGRYNGFRVSDSEINRTLLLRLLEAERPEERDFEILVENAESLGVPDEDIAKIYGRMKYVYESEGTYVNGELQASGKIVEITKYFKPVKERIERKQQEQQSQQDENMPKSLEEALEEIRRLRKEVSDLKTHNNMLQGKLKMQEMRHGNQNGGMIVQPERQVLNL